MSDILQRFVFERHPIRGELVQLDAAWKALLEGRGYPPVVRALLGETLAAAVLLSATLKYAGKLSLQVQGDGPLSLLVVEATAARTLRGVAHWSGVVPERGLREQFGGGKLVITIDPGAGLRRYQGIVELEGDSLHQAIEGYLIRSEQLPTRMWLVSDGNRMGGLLLQRLPGDADDADGWNRAVTLGATVQGEELLTLEPPQVARRLFHEEDLRLFGPEPLAFRCACSRERVAGVLRNLGREEVRAIVASEGSVIVHCEFCNRRYEFDAVDAEQLFADGFWGPVPETRQ